MRAKLPPLNPRLPSGMEIKAALERWLTGLRGQSRLVLASYVCALIGARLTIYDFHHYRPWKFGLSTPILGAAIVLYVLGRRRQ